MLFLLFSALTLPLPSLAKPLVAEDYVVSAIALKDNIGKAGIVVRHTTDKEKCTLKIQAGKMFVTEKSSIGTNWLRVIVDRTEAEKNGDLICERVDNGNSGELFFPKPYLEFNISSTKIDYAQLNLKTNPIYNWDDMDDDHDALDEPLAIVDSSHASGRIKETEAYDESDNIKVFKDLKRQISDYYKDGKQVLGWKSEVDQIANIILTGSPTRKPDIEVVESLLASLAEGERDYLKLIESVRRKRTSTKLPKDCPPGTYRRNQDTIVAQSAGDLVKNVASAGKINCYINSQIKKLNPKPNTASKETRLKNFSDVTSVLKELDISNLFRIQRKDQILSVDTEFMKCLWHRESVYDFQATSHTNALGLGQQTNVNINHINSRISKKGSWEQMLWRNFFDKAWKNPSTKKMIQECQKSFAANGASIDPFCSAQENKFIDNDGYPAFACKQHAACPLTSMAASLIYNLQIQNRFQDAKTIAASRGQSLSLGPEDNLNYQLAIGAAYNLGDGAAASAVKNMLSVSGWPEAIKNASPNPGKKAEVTGHIKAIASCLAGSETCQ